MHKRAHSWRNTEYIRRFWHVFLIISLYSFSAHPSGSQNIYCTNTAVSWYQWRTTSGERKQAERFHRFVFMTRSLWYCHEVPLKGHGWLFLSLWNASSSHSFTYTWFLVFSQHTHPQSKSIKENIQIGVIPPWEYTRPQRALPSHCFISDQGN